MPGGVVGPADRAYVFGTPTEPMPNRVNPRDVEVPDAVPGE
jgi:hypothetical protein